MRVLLPLVTTALAAWVLFLLIWVATDTCVSHDDKQVADGWHAEFRFCSDETVKDGRRERMCMTVEQEP